MITSKPKFRLPKMNIDEKALKGAIKQVAKDVKQQIKTAVPKLTGALKSSVDTKTLKSKPTRAYTLIGVKAHFEKAIKRKKQIVAKKIPNKYAAKVGVKTVIARFLTDATVSAILSAFQTIKGKLLQ